MDGTEKKEPRQKRKEHPIFTIFIHAGYTVLVLSMIAWMVYIKFIM